MTINDYIQQGIKFFQEGNIDSALENFESALKLQPDNEDIKKMVEMMNTQKQMLLKNNGKKAETMDTTEEDKNIAEYSEKLRQNPDDASAKSALASALYRRGLVHTNMGEHVKAVEDYTEAIKNQPDYPLAINKRGWANLEVGNYDQAIKDFEKIIEFKPNDAQSKKSLAIAYQKRGIAYDRKGDYAHAIPDFEMVLKLDPENSSARELIDMDKAEMAKKN